MTSPKQHSSRAPEPAKPAGVSENCTTELHQDSAVVGKHQHDHRQAAENCSIAARLAVYNTATHSVEPFEPIVPGQVGMYVCGATVQSSPHIGHIRAGVAFDVVRRWLEKLGFKVTFIRNVTDIDDKILTKAHAAGQQWWERAYIYEREFTHAYETLGVMAPTYEPRATGHIGDMVELIEQLINNGHAYVIKDADGKPTGNVFFDVASWPRYGELTRQKQNDETHDARPSEGSDASAINIPTQAARHTDAAETGAAAGTDANAEVNTDRDADTAITDQMGPSVDRAGNDRYNPADPADNVDGKRDPRDFALWKASKPSDPATARWQTPFGEGRPGWHIECSAMSHRYLYNPAQPSQSMFDIHGGGLDLRFPHHENEMAQSLAAGWDSANVWMHSAWVTAKGEKMSKSLGNGLSVPAVLAEHSAWVVRYALGTVHYRSMLEWSDQTLAEAQAAYERINNFTTRAGEALSAQPSRDEVAAVSATELPEDFVTSMNNDFSISGATAAIFSAIREGNAQMSELAEAQAAGKSTTDVQGRLHATLLSVRAMLDVLGLDPLAEPWAAGAHGQSDSAQADGAATEHEVLDAMVHDSLDARSAARAAKNFEAADRIRDYLTAKGITIEDGRDGSTWSLK